LSTWHESRIELGKFFALPVTRANEALKRLDSPSSDEMEFLNLFSVVQSREILVDVPATHLSNNVYRAGLRLAATGVLLHQKTKEGKDRFTFTNALAEAWKREKDILLIRDHGDIHPDTVLGTGSSGGGASKPSLILPSVPHTEEPPS
jgi:hypothetical protein